MLLWATSIGVTNMYLTYPHTEVKKTPEGVKTVIVTRVDIKDMITMAVKRTADSTAFAGRLSLLSGKTMGRGGARSISEAENAFAGADEHLSGRKRSVRSGARDGRFANGHAIEIV